MDKMAVYIFLFLFSVFIASLAQIALKKSSGRKYKSIKEEYLNPPVIIAYLVFFGSTVLTTMAYRGVPLSYGPILEATGYIYIVILGKLFLQERITKRKLLGNLLIIIGILIYSFL